MSSNFLITTDSNSELRIGYDYGLGITTVGNADEPATNQVWVDFRSMEPIHPVIGGGEVGIGALNHNERRDDEMLVSKEAFLEACADSNTKLSRPQRKIIKDMEHDEWRYFLARLLLGGELAAVLDEFKDEPLLVKNVDA